jgi:hypothetical protein
MSVFSQFFSQSAIAPHFSDPRRFLRFSTASVNLGANVADYFTGQVFSMDRHGDDDDTNFSAGVAKTVLNIPSGSGYVSGVVGPTLTNVGDTAIFTIVVDGASYSITVTNQVASGRCYLGIVNSPNGFFTTADRYYGSNGGVSTDVSTIYMGAPALRAPADVETAMQMGVGMLYFSASLLIQITSSINQTGTANQERRSGTFFQRLS